MPASKKIKKYITNVSKHFILICLSLCITTNYSLAGSKITKINFVNSQLLEISLEKKVDFSVFTLQEPNRLVIDIVGLAVSSDIDDVILPYFVKNIRHQFSNNKTRIVFDLDQKISILNFRYEKLRGNNDGKIIIKISETKKISTNKKEQNIDPKIDHFIFTKTKEFESLDKTSNQLESVKIIPKPVITKKPVIVIDAGHGGKDPGAIGSYLKTKEKNITLSYARELAKQLTDTKKYTVYLTRNHDFFIPLRNRVEVSRKKQADIFISLHANSASDSSVSGFSIYTLSQTSSDKQAEALANKENRADIIHGVNFSGATYDIMKTLIDLSQRESMNNSARFAGMVINSMKSSKIEILQNTHRFAGFAVLTAPDMASVLVELGYLTNNKEERLLNSLAYKRKIAQSLVLAINKYFDN